MLFKNISGEFFFSADVEGYDSYISFEDEDCKFTNGGYPVDEDIIKRFIQDTITRYVAKF